MTFSAVLVGHDSLTLACGRMLREAGHALRAVATRHAATQAWAEAEGVPVLAPGEGLAGRLPGGFDWLLSVANLDVLPPDVLARPRRGAVNFHDGPLPDYAGLNVPVWALLNGEARHGITWHLIGGGVDEGPVIAARRFALDPGETAASLNAKCFAAALESFPEVMGELDGEPRPHLQDLSRRRLFRRTDRPDAVLDPWRPAEEGARLVRALDHGSHANPVGLARLDLGGAWAVVLGAAEAPGAGAPGTVLEGGAAPLLACATGALRLSLVDPLGRPLALGQGTRLPAPLVPDPSAIREAARAEGRHRAALLDWRPAALPPLGGEPAGRPLAGPLPEGERGLALALLLPGDLGWGRPESRGATASWSPLPVRGRTLGERRAALRDPGPMALDLPLRLGREAPEAPAVALGPVPGARLWLDGDMLHADASVPEAVFDLLRARAAHLIGAVAGLPDDAPVAAVPRLSPRDAALLASFNATEAPWDASPLPDQVHARAARTPLAPAVTFRDRTLTYADLAVRVGRLAGALRALGAGPGVRVGLHLPRSDDLVAAALAVMATGAAYVPLDPAYPEDRVALYLEDSEAAVVVTTAALAPRLPPHGARVLPLDAPLPEGPDGPGPRPEDAAYVIYTSGSTGRPKGVVVTHANVASFLAAMDRVVEPGGTWLAVTSLSFDISVLELFWTLSRGAHVVVQGDEERTSMAGEGGTAFSLFHWGNDDGEGRDKYRLLLESSRFADAHGFRAVWTPERHFHAFGGPYPNPAVTGAAVAAVTRNLDVRAGSCVAPLHHPLRIAEEWAVVDNLTAGRAGLAIASGWQPEDFVLRPEAAPPKNRAAMVEAIGTLRRLWRGEAVEFDGPLGPQRVLSQPRPVSRELPVWVTTAGNPDTWREAGRLGAHVLTHLLGQTVDEVRDKVALYHAALREAGHDPARFQVTLMLHTYLAGTRERAREAAREPMKAYLRSAAALIKGYAWAFPAFKKPEGAASPADLDLRSLSPEEMDAILDFAFERYFQDQGLFGTVEDALARVAQVRAAGVTEVACLIDYGLPADMVLEGLKPLAEVVAQAGAPDWSLAAQVRRHGVTHLQCTPSMARMLLAHDDSRAALGGLRHLLVGGEGLPGSLAADLLATGARLSNMYGPTETTVWSATAEPRGAPGTEPVGRPIANASLRVVDETGVELPPGEEGEVVIGGPGVAQGYWGRPDLTAERFVESPWGRVYHTGDLGRWRLDGSLDFLGRMDGQVKLRGHRIETGEIEAALDALPGVSGSVVVLREDAPGDPRLVAFVLAAPGFDAEGARAALARRLPAVMVPARVARLDALPQTPNRKTDRKALAGPAYGPPASATRPAPAQAPAVAVAPVAAPAFAAAPAGGSLPAVAAVWSRLLGVSPIPADASFFDLGGHSLLAVQAHRDLRAELGVPRLAITDVFRFPTLGALARRIDELSAGSIRPPPVAPPVAAEARAPAPVGAPGDLRAEAMARRAALRARRGA